MSDTKRVCVFCGSSAGNNQIFQEKATELGRALAKAHYGLVYGGGSVGLMNAVADAVIAGGGEVQGVIPRHLMNKEHDHHNLAALHITDTMQERKMKMSELSDAFVVLPGGFGTLDELMEMTTWLQLGLHHKPVVLLNINGYYQSLLSFLDHAVENGFISEQNLALLQVVHSVEECCSLLPHYGHTV